MALHRLGVPAALYKVKQLSRKNSQISINDDGQNLTRTLTVLPYRAIILYIYRKRRARKAKRKLKRARILQRRNHITVDAGDSKFKIK